MLPGADLSLPALGQGQEADLQGGTEATAEAAADRMADMTATGTGTGTGAILAEIMEDQASEVLRCNWCQCLLQSNICPSSQRC